MLASPHRRWSSSLTMCRIPATWEVSCERPKPRARLRSSPRRRPLTRLAGRRCAARWAARCDCRSRARRSTRRCTRSAQAKITTSRSCRAAVSRSFDARFRTPSAFILGGEGVGLPPEISRSESISCVSIPMHAPGRIAQRRRRRRARALRGIPSDRRHMSLFDDLPTDTAPATHSRHPARGTDASCHLRRVRRPGGHPCPGQTAARSHRTRSPAVDHPVGTAGHRQDDTRPAHCQSDARAIRLVQRGAGRHQGNQGGHGGGRTVAAPHEPAHHRVRRRDSPLQQISAGCVSSARRSGRHRADRRDDRKSLLRGERGAAVPLEGVTRCAGSPRRK